jgi:hypothetical protein
VIALKRMQSPIVSLLAKLPDEELVALRDQARDDLAQLQVELGQIEAAIERRTPRPTGRSGKRGDTRRRVLEAIGNSDRPLTPSDVGDVLSVEENPPSAGSIHNMMGRLVKEGELERVGNGLYRLATRKSAFLGGFAGPTENGSEGQLSPEPDSQEAARQDA